jgi:ABC-2 type transport system ATP-binding protein
MDIVRRDGRTVFMTSHNLNEVEQMCSRIAILQSGHLYALGTIADLRRRIESPQLAIFANQPSALPALSVQVKALPFVVNCEINFDHLLVQLAKEVPPTGLWEAQAHSGIAIDEIKKVGMSLEEMYLDIVSKAEAIDDEPGSDGRT